MDAAYTALLAAADTAARQSAADALAAEVKKAGLASKAAGDLVAKVLKSFQASGKAGAAEREAACWAFKSLGALGPASLYAVRDMLLEVLKLQSDKVKEVTEAAKTAVEVVHPLLTAYNIKLLMPTLLSACDGANKHPTQVAALNLIKACSHKAPIECSECTPDIIPIVTPMMSDIKAEVKAASAEVVEEICQNTNNRDIEPVLSKLVSAMKNVAESEECIHALAATTFVQVVGSAALSITVPLLVRGFKERKTAVKRQCAVIVENMSKLVLEPRDATPFLPQLIPALERASEEISDPEARERCSVAHGHLVRIRDAAQAAGPKVDVEKVAAAVKSVVGGDSANMAFINDLAASLVFYKVDDEEEWQESLEHHMAAAGKGKEVVKKLYAECEKLMNVVAKQEEEGDDAEELCNCKFTLAYGAKILLHNTVLRLKRGYRYGLLGGNDSGKTTLMRAIANGQVEGFPPSTELRTVFVEADIQGDLSDLNVVDYVFADDRIKSANVPREDVEKMLSSVGFTERMIKGGVAHLSGGWRMKLALARAMLLRADILLLDEPTNHLDVINVAWVKDYLNSLHNVTSIMVSHDTGLLNDVCTHIIQIENLKLVQERGNLASFVKNHPTANAFFELKASKLKFKFPQPGYIEGVKSKGKPLMKMDHCDFTYPGNDKPTISHITVRVSLASRVACVGVNGAGKSTMIKLLTGQLIPQTGDVWKHPNCRVAYVAQHAFVHIEQHLTKTPNEYIQWRYQGGEDKEALEKATMVLTEEEEAKIKENVELTFSNEEGVVTKVKRVIGGLTGARRTNRKENEYEIRFSGMSHDSNLWYPGEKLEKLGWGKHIKAVDDKIALRAGQYVRPLTKDNVEKHLEDVGLDREFGTHHRMSALSGGQKVKVVLAAAMWNQPHILILDEPTNYLDRESLGALSSAIEEFEGGVVMITHNNEFCSKLCPETWVLENGRLDCKGDAAWMENVMNEKTEFKAVEEMVDALGNVTKVKAPKKKLSRKEMKAKAKIRKAKLERGEEVSSDDEDWDEEL